MYKLLIKPLLFLFDPEKAHYIATDWLTFMCKLPGGVFLIRALYNFEDKKLERNLFGLTCFLIKNRMLTKVV